MGDGNFFLIYSATIITSINFDYAPMGDGNSHMKPHSAVIHCINFDYAPMGDGNTCHLVIL